ncbi:hypothetical protein AB0C14_17865 [Microbispora hainanensis]|uniref:hypothetical protein n=1 Tax=Microbispora hainanensis TaxID=568844 RepID=UPI00340E905A
MSAGRRARRAQQVRRGLRVSRGRPVRVVSAAWWVPRVLPVHAVSRVRQVQQVQQVQQVRRVLPVRQVRRGLPALRVQ